MPLQPQGLGPAVNGPRVVCPPGGAQTVRLHAVVLWALQEGKGPSTRTRSASKAESKKES